MLAFYFIMKSINFIKIWLVVMCHRSVKKKNVQKLYLFNLFLCILYYIEYKYSIDYWQF